MYNDPVEGKSSGYRIYTVEKIDQERNRVYLKDFSVGHFRRTMCIVNNPDWKSSTTCIQTKGLGRVGHGEKEDVVEIQRHVPETVEVGSTVKRWLARSREQAGPFVSLACLVKKRADV